MDQRPRRLLDQTRDVLREKGYSIYSALLLLYREVLEQERGPVSALRPRRPQYLPAAVLTPTEVKQVISTWRPVMARSTVKPGRGLG